MGNQDQILTIKKYVNYPFHFICYYIVWIITIFLAARNYSLMAPLLAFIIIALQYVWQHFVIRKTKGLLIFSVYLVSAGYINDTCFIYFHLFRFLANPFPYPLSPPWMLMLWLDFAISLYAIGRGFLENIYILIVFCLLGYPFAYWFGVRMGAVISMVGVLSYIIIAITGTIIVLTGRFVLERYSDKAT